MRVRGGDVVVPSGAKPQNASAVPAHRAPRYDPGMLERTSTRLLPLTNRVADVAPVAPACCNACRTCMTTNVVGLAMAGGVAIVAFGRRLLRRKVRAEPVL